MPGYLEEEGANKTSNTETFVAIRVDIDNWRWAGVPFYLRTGKRLPTKCSEVVVYFKTPELNLFKETPAGAAAEQADHSPAAGRRGRYPVY